MYATYLLGILIYPFKGVDGHIPLTTFFKLSKNGSLLDIFSSRSSAQTKILGFMLLHITNGD